ncbi:hypothetical protein [Halomonas alkalisoli]|uniref:hypothetical protein n=1 Tax=Halomonas alkalisoli TaxID=2907158 RepID=UPI001F397B07|nr:hypothetical protein [Halomonas alkalisoli]MCE9681818.1 hypothetical protein [Halomonas alkalisoli]
MGSRPSWRGIPDLTAASLRPLQRQLATLHRHAAAHELNYDSLQGSVGEAVAELLPSPA